MLAKIIATFVMIVIAVVLYPTINSTIQVAQTNITSTPSGISSELVTMLNLVPMFFIATVILVAILMIWNAFRDSGIDGVDDDESDKEDEEDSEEKDADSDEASNRLSPTKKHSTIVTTTKKTGEKKMNITVGPGYNVDKYELDKPADNKLSYKEGDFKKTKFD